MIKKLFLLIVFGGAAVAIFQAATGIKPTAPTLSPADQEAQAEGFKRRDAVKSLTIKNLSWSGDMVMIASFTVVNPSDYEIKDVKVECVHSAASGTKIDSNTRTIYEIVPARGQKAIRDFNMGFINSQAKRSGCSVSDATVVAYKPPPAPKTPAPAPKPSGKPLSTSQ